MTLNPFLMGSPEHLQCFDEKSPCILEQTSICVINIAEKNDQGSKFPGQKMYVPWLSCMDSNGDETDTCHKQVGIDPRDVQSCLVSDIKQLLPAYLAKDKSIRGTPTVYINGKKVEASYTSIKAAICLADSTLPGCGAVSPADADWVPDKSRFFPPTASLVV